MQEALAEEEEAEDREENRVHDEPDPHKWDLYDHSPSKHLSQILV